jgi:Flp pilus assembly CpaE family ATPase
LVVVAHHDPGTADSLRHAVETAVGWQVVVSDPGPAGLAEAMAAGPSVALLGCALLADLPSGWRTPLIAVGDDDHPADIRAALAAGARSLLAWPDGAADLPGELARVAAAGHALAGRFEGLVVAVRGVHGGAGTTTLAVHLAAAWARWGPAPVLLADLAGGLAYRLDLGTVPTWSRLTLPTSPRAGMPGGAVAAGSLLASVTGATSPGGAVAAGSCAPVTGATPPDEVTAAGALAPAMDAAPSGVASAAGSPFVPATSPRAGAPAGVAAAGSRNAASHGGAVAGSARGGVWSRGPEDAGSLEDERRGESADALSVGAGGGCPGGRRGEAADVLSVGSAGGDLRAGAAAGAGMVLDPGTLVGVLAEPWAGLSVLPMGSLVDGAVDAAPEPLVVQEVLETARSTYRLVVLDLPATAGEATQAALGTADTLVAVGRCETAGVRGLQAALAAWAAAGGEPDTAGAVVTGVRAQAPLAPREVRAALGDRLWGLIPSAASELSAAAEDGVLLLDRHDLPAVQAMLTLANRIVPFAADSQ